MRAAELSVVVTSPGVVDPAGVVASALRSLRVAGATGQVVLVWQAPSSPPPLPEGVVVVRAAAAGQSYARNAGAEASNAPLLAFLDGEARVHESWARGVLAAFADGADAVFGADRSRWVGRDELPWTVGTSANMAITRAVLERAGGFDRRLGAGSFGRSAEDTFLIARLQRSGALLLRSAEMRVDHTPARSGYADGFGVGRVVRRLRSAPLAARYGLDLVSRRRAAAAHGFLKGALRPDRWTAPLDLLERLPDELRNEVGVRKPRGLAVPHRAEAHFMYALGDDRLLHVYGAPTDVQREAVGMRERFGLPPGVPRLHGAVETATELWVLEDRLLGAPAAPAQTPAWWAPAVGLLMSLGRRPGEPVREGRWWQERSASLPHALGPEWESPLSDALARVGELPSVIAHCDVQPKNVLVDHGRIGLVDWDGACAEGLPGFDLLFMAVTARSPRPDPEPLLALARGADAPGVPLQTALRLGREDARAVALVAAASWVAEELARGGRTLGRDSAPARDYAALLERAGPALVGERLAVRAA